MILFRLLVFNTLTKGTLILLHRNSYYQKGTHQKGTLVLLKGTLILLNRNTHIIKKEHSYYQKGTHQKGTLVLSKGTLILLNRNTHIIKKEHLCCVSIRVTCRGSFSGNLIALVTCRGSSSAPLSNRNYLKCVRYPDNVVTVNSLCFSSTSQSSRQPMAKNNSSGRVT